MSKEQVWFSMKIGVTNDGEALIVLNQEIYYTKLGLGQDKVGNYRKKGSDMDPISSLRVNIIPQHGLKNMCIQNKSVGLGIIKVNWDTLKD